VEDDTPPIGLSEDEAFRPRPLVVISAYGAVGATMGLGLLMVLQGATVLVYPEAREKWAFWGDPDVLASLLILSGTGLMAGGVLAMLRRDVSLVVILLGVMVFEVTMLFGVLFTENESERLLFLIIMFLPFAFLMVFQTDAVRQWLFMTGDDEGPSEPET